MLEQTPVKFFLCFRSEVALQCNALVNHVFEAEVPLYEDSLDDAEWSMLARS